MHKLLLGCGLVVLLTSCSDDAMYDQFVRIPETGWHSDSSVQFNVLVEDTATSYAIYFRMRHNAGYPYQNLYLFREITSEDGREFSDTVAYTLAKPTGEWLGKGFGSLKTIETPFTKNVVRFNRRGTYTFHIGQGMREEYLKGIEEIGLRIEPVNTQTNGSNIGEED